MASQIVMIAGLTGRLGQLIAYHLLQRSQTVVVHGLVRNSMKLPRSLLVNPRVKLFEGNSADLLLARTALLGASIAVCCYLGNNKLMIEGQKLLIDACVAEKVPRYMASDWTIDFRKLDHGDHPMKDPMKHIDEYLQKKEAEGKIKAVHILNGCFMEIVVDLGAWLDLDTWTLHYWGTGDEKWELTSYADAAAYSAEIILDPSATGWFSVRGDFVSMREQAAALGLYIGGDPPTMLRCGSLEECIAGAKNQIRSDPKNLPGCVMDLYFYFCANGQTHTPAQELANERVSSVRPMTFFEFLETDPSQKLKALRRNKAYL